jgi:hypothetical protein
VDPAELSCVREEVGGQFNVYVCDRFVVPALTPGQQCQIADGRLILDQMTRNFIREHLGYRYAIHPGGTTALAARSERCEPAASRRGSRCSTRCNSGRCHT